MKRLLPPRPADLRTFLVGDVCCQDSIEQKLLKPLHLVAVHKYKRAEGREPVLHQHIPRYIDGPFLSNAAVFILDRKGVFFLYKYRVRDALVLDVMHERRKHDDELSEGIGADPERPRGDPRDVLLIVLVRRADLVDELARRHGDVTGVVEVVERHVIVLRGDARNVLKELEAGVHGDDRVTRNAVVVLPVRAFRKHDLLRKRL
mmetsp:Transcript_29609/g.66431  ORF Transcript_29609/g.66431 Transcript_29609/m.66431 type:complete len:204 (+) Transcript_29609:663-1274(+)